MSLGDLIGSVTAAKSRSKDVSDGHVVSTLLRRIFVSPWARKRYHKEEDEGIRGPLGLHLIHESPEPLVDLIFVHGLRGGSIKTWRKGKDRRWFWPQFWLPKEPGFENVNVITFGYDSDWASLNANMLDVQDFGIVLLEQVRNAPYLRGNGERPIILIGHSMGGLVIKNVYIRAQDVPELKGRIRAMFFLATPHRGSNHATTLNNVVNVFGIKSSRHYISDLMTASVSLQSINDDFEKHAHDLPIFSFCEGLKTSLGVSSILVVDKESAVLGSKYSKERVQYVNANHRDICKFESTDDPNYVTVKDALAGAIASIQEDISASSRKDSEALQMKVLRSYLGIWDIPDDLHPKANGSCRWIDTRDDFQNWRDGIHDSPAEDDSPSNSKNDTSIFWVQANPGTGKTFLASYVISHLQESQLGCSYYYCHAGKNASRPLGQFLKSIAYRMAMSNSSIRNKLSQLCHDVPTFDTDHISIIWMKLFRNGILQASPGGPQYLVIDAIDECDDYQEFLVRLRDEKPNFPLRLFITSRNMYHIQVLRDVLYPSIPVTSIKIPFQNSIHDIGCYIDSQIHNLPVTNSPASREKLKRKILSKSNASFLWVRLVLDELENVYSFQSVTTVLERIPEDMIPYYERIIKRMAANALEKHIAKEVIAWTTMCARNLTLPELSQVLALNKKIALPESKTAMESLCGHLVTIDENSSVIDLVHPTAREFLLSEAAGEFRVSKPDVHEQIALSSLQLLLGNELRPPRNPRFLAHARPELSTFLDYAMTQFSEHVYSASSGNDQLLVAIDKFFKTHILSWIERLALRGDLHSIIRASKNLKAYLERSAQDLSPLSSEGNKLGSWPEDLVKMVTHFGEALQKEPSSIYFLIPPLCPPESAIYQQYGKRPDALSLVGSRRTLWDDHLAHVTFSEDTPSRVFCGAGLIAVPTIWGDVNLYNHHSCQKEAVISHGKYVDQVHITDDLIAMSTINSVLLQEHSGNVIWENRLRFRCLLVTSTDNRIFAVAQHGHLLQWDKATGELLYDRDFEYQVSDFGKEQNYVTCRAPQDASISPDFETLALGYRGGDVCLWDIREEEFIGWAKDERYGIARRVLFNPNPNINLLVVIYTNHNLTLHETWSGSLVRSHTTPDKAGFLSASCSPDGRTLVTAEPWGSMYIWDFQSITPLYRITLPSSIIKGIGFTSDSANVVYLGESGMRVWSPDVLTHKTTEDDPTSKDSAIQLVIPNAKYESPRDTKIAVICVHPSTPTVFAGKSNGDVIEFDAKTGISRLLYSHSSMKSVEALAVSQNNIIVSADYEQEIQIRSLSPSAGTMSLSSPILKIPMTDLVKQLCFSANEDYLLVAAGGTDSVHRVRDGSCIGSWTFKSYKDRNRKWIVFPPRLGLDDSQQFSLLSNGTIRHFSAESFPSPSSNDMPEIQLEFTSSKDSDTINFTSAVVSSSIGILALEVQYTLGSLPSTTFIFDVRTAVSASKESPPVNSISLAPLSTLLSRGCRYFVGLSEPTKSIFFLHKNSWLCSTTMPDLADGRYTQHFFVPNGYVTRKYGEATLIQMAEDDVVFCLGEDLVSVRNGLGFRATKSLE